MNVRVLIEKLQRIAQEHPDADVFVLDPDASEWRSVQYVNPVARPGSGATVVLVE